MFGIKDFVLFGKSHHSGFYQIRLLVIFLFAGVILLIREINLKTVISS